MQTQQPPEKLKQSFCEWTVYGSIYAVLTEISVICHPEKHWPLVQDSQRSLFQPQTGRLRWGDLKTTILKFQFHQLQASSCWLMSGKLSACFSLLLELFRLELFSFQPLPSQPTLCQAPPSDSLQSKGPFLLQLASWILPCKTDVCLNSFYSNPLLQACHFSFVTWTLSTNEGHLAIQCSFFF